jgi:hypothetical protein
VALVTVGGKSVIRGAITMPRVGAWHAELEVVTDEDVSGRVTIDVAGGLTLSGTASGGGRYGGRYRVRVVAGADGLRTLAKPKHYVDPVVRTPLTDLARAAGETLSPTIAARLLDRRMTDWTVLEASTGAQIGALVERATPEGTSWRMLPDGTLWMGTETWPALDVEARESGRDLRDNRVDVALDAPLLVAGATLGGDRIDYAYQRIEPDRVWAQVWVAP